MFGDRFLGFSSFITAKFIFKSLLWSFKIECITRVYYVNVKFTRGELP
uniref:Uncharacterized protein n=1 Tax=virus sp. ctHG14 TaxID=2827626 RepID=A0A8S5RJZ4_9VIRU|nr:MAG TPA: hypothetical protein [virus sp. ctHG14]